MGSDERHFNVSLIVRDKDSVRIETTTFEERTAEGKSRTEVLLFTSGLMPYLKAKLIHIVLYCIMAIHESFKVRCRQRPQGLLGRDWEPRAATSIFTQLLSSAMSVWVSFCCLTSTEARRPIMDGDEWERGIEEWNLETGANPEDQGCRGPPPEQQDVKAVSVRQCTSRWAMARGHRLKVKVQGL